MSLFERFKNASFTELVKDQNLKDLLIRREFRITQDYLQREFLDRAIDEELQDLTLTLRDGYGTISGKVKKRLVPFALPFSARFAVHGMEFTSARKNFYLRLEEVGPVDLEWLTRKMVDSIPFLSCMGDLITCDLTKVPRLAELFAYQVRGIKVWDFVTLKEMDIRYGEIVGRVGVVL
jgi:hypothetical protein